MGKFASELKRLREAKELSVRAMAGELGKSPGYISRVEGRGEIPSMEFVLMVADYFGVSIELLLELIKEDQLSKFERDIDHRHQKTVKLFRKGKRK